MKTYQTSQRSLLHDFLRQHPHNFYTAKELVEKLTDDGKSISVSAIYRNLSDLTDSGTIKKILKKSSREASYRYIDSELCRNQIHVTCSVCGKIFHLNQDISNLIQEKLTQENGFILDRAKTVISGTCKDCLDHKN